MEFIVLPQCRCLIATSSYILGDLIKILLKIKTALKIFTKVNKIVISNAALCLFDSDQCIRFIIFCSRFVPLK